MGGVRELTAGASVAWATRLLAIVVAVGLTACTSTSIPSSPSGGTAEKLKPPLAAGSFALLTEVYGQGGPLLDQRLRETLANGAAVHPVLDGEERASVEVNGRPFTYFAIPAEAEVSACYPDSTDVDAATTLRAVGVTAQSSAWRLGMPEFDQSGGCWAQNR